MIDIGERRAEKDQGVVNDDDTYRIFQATQKLQNEMRMKLNNPNALYSDQLYMNLQ